MYSISTLTGVASTGEEALHAAADMPDPVDFQQRRKRAREHSDNESADEVNDQDFEDLLVAGDGTAPRSWTPPSFMEREAYRQLVAEGLAGLPPVSGVGLRYHRSTSQWHGVYGSTNFAPTWGDIRSERVALLMALHGVWQMFANSNPNDKDAQDHVSVLKAMIEA